MKKAQLVMHVTSGIIEKIVTDSVYGKYHQRKRAIGKKES